MLISQLQALANILVAFLIRTEILRPQNEFNIDVELSKHDVDRLIKVIMFRSFGIQLNLQQKIDLYG